MAVVDYFLKLDGISGESNDAKHKGEIELESFTWSLEQAGSRTVGGGGGAGKVSFGDLSFVQRTNKASTALMLSVATGKHIASGLLTARKSGGTAVEFLKIKLTDVLVSTFNIAGDDDYPVEEIALDAAKYEVTYTAQDAKGGSVTGGEFKWDVKSNKAL